MNAGKHFFRICQFQGAELQPVPINASLSVNAL
jgi:hypothetical protein